MSERPDIAIIDSAGRLTGIIETKRKMGTSSEWASLLRRNLLRDFLPFAELFVIATPDRIYIWEQGSEVELSGPPTRVVDATELFAHYLPDSGENVTVVSGAVFELVVANWLADVHRGGAHAVPIELASSDLVQLARSGSIEYQNAA